MIIDIALAILLVMALFIIVPVVVIYGGAFLLMAGAVFAVLLPFLMVFGVIDAPALENVIGVLTTLAFGGALFWAIRNAEDFEK